MQNDTLTVNECDVEAGMVFQQASRFLWYAGIPTPTYNPEGFLIYGSYRAFGPYSSLTVARCEYAANFVLFKEELYHTQVYCNNETRLETLLSYLVQELSANIDIQNPQALGVLLGGEVKHAKVKIPRTHYSYH